MFKDSTMKTTFTVPRMVHLLTMLMHEETILRLTPDSRAPAKNWADAVLVLAFVLGSSASLSSSSPSSSSPTFSASASCSYSLLGQLAPV